jgi:hypothetical protein
MYVHCALIKNKGNFREISGNLAKIEFPPGGIVYFCGYLFMRFLLNIPLFLTVHGGGMSQEAAPSIPLIACSNIL